jgi:hypothetical protein
MHPPAYGPGVKLNRYGRKYGSVLFIFEWQFHPYSSVAAPFYGTGA